MSESTDSQFQNNVTVEGFLNAAKDFDRIMLEAVEAGMESGRSIGVIESYNLLVKKGYDSAAEALMELIHEEAEIRKSRADA